MVSTRSSSGLTPRPPKTFPGDLVPTPKPRGVGRPPKSSTATSARGLGGYTHRPTAVTLAWLAASLPLVAWDTGYVLLRPHSMPGGRLHRPLWAAYELYGRVDHVYGAKAWEARSGFTGAQAFMNLVESLLYLAYWGLWFRNRGVGAAEGRVAGRKAAVAVVVGFAAAVMTFSKTVLYWLNEYYSGFDNIGHNSLWSLVWLWIIPNGLWLVFPAYMIYSLGGEIVDALAGGSGPAVKAE